MTAASRIRLLTGADLQLSDDRTDLSAPRPRALFVLLALNAGKPVSRDRLCDYLWPYTDQSTARRRLRMALLNMRRVLSEDLCDCLTASAENLALDIRRDDVDALHFAALADVATPEAQEAAIALYDGDLLAQFPPISDVFDRLIADRREECRSILLTLLHDQMRARSAAGDLSGFERVYRRALKLDRTNDGTAALAMAAAAADGQARRVQEIFDAYAAALSEAFEVPPPEEMSAACKTFLDEAARQVPGAARTARRRRPAVRLTELRARPRVALRLSRRQKWIAAAAGGLLCAVILIAGGFLWSLDLRRTASEGPVFLVRPDSAVVGDCRTEGDQDAIERAMLDALQRIEGSNTVLGAVRHRLIGAGPGIFEVDLAITCDAGSVRATITVVDTESRGIAFVGRYYTDPSGARDLSERLHAELSRTLRR